MTVKSGRLQFLTPHVLRSHLLRPGLIRLSLRLGLAQQMPSWAKLQFLNQGVSPADLEHVLSRITSLESWVNEWETLGNRHEGAGRAARADGRERVAARHFLSATAAYNFAQYVLFFDVPRKRGLHDACVHAYAQAAPLLDPPARTVTVRFRNDDMVGYLRLPHGVRPAPLVVMFNGTNAVKEELHGWSEALLERGLAVLAFDGPGLGRTWHRLSMVAEPRPVGTTLLDALERLPEVESKAIAFAGMSLGGYLAIRMAAHDPRVRAVAAVSPPFSADIYWNVTLAAMRRELAALYNTDERTMAACVDRITLADVLPSLRCPLLVVGGGRDLITPGREAWRIFENAPCDRELIYYPTGAHDCFNMLADLRPRLVSWLGRQLGSADEAPAQTAPEPARMWMPAEAVDPEFADALSGDGDPALRWHPHPAAEATPTRDGSAAPRWPWLPAWPLRPTHTQVVLRRASGSGPRPPLDAAEAPAAL
jgi:2,6-dihydroxypseudooxynicotine hydrolase